MEHLRILMIASEAAPLLRTGGLGDVMGALPQALTEIGHDVQIALPLYSAIDTSTYSFESTDITFPVSVGGTLYPTELLRYRVGDVSYLLLYTSHFCDRPGVYIDPATGTDFPDNDERFVWFCRAALEAVIRLEWPPQILHCHDWQAAVLPALLRDVYATTPTFQQSKTILTIHNLGYQGLFPGNQFERLGISEALNAPMGPFEFFGQVNFLKAGIVMSDVITTVSPRYAEEIISSEEMGFGLQGVLQKREKSLRGILNGVDYADWSPNKDPYLAYRYTASNLSRKRMNKVELMNEAKLPVRENAPLIGMITRLAEQKGLDILTDAADELFARDVQLVILGSGDARYEALLQELEDQFPDQLKVYLRFDTALSHRIEAASDIFLMPSRYEPCGLNQMYSLRYGAVPVARNVGGLANTIIDVDVDPDNGTGFLFDAYTGEAMLAALDRAIARFQRKRAWTKIVKTGMRQDFSWDRSAEQYASLYSELLS